MHNIRNIAFAGSGNVAWHLAKGLSGQGFVISGIWSRNYANAKSLADSCDSVAIENITELGLNADLIIIAVPDKSIEEVASAIVDFNGIVVHTAGSVSMNVLKGKFEHYGVLYPLQTFSKEIQVNMAEVPFFIESSSAETGLALKEAASKLSVKVYEADSHQRLLLHISAVFASNFSNLMYVIGNELLKSSDLPPEVLYPLIAETARKATTGDPLKLQTGPARRNDMLTIEKHMAALASQPKYAEIYGLLSKLISNNYK
jgi:predicted short-subunit dehydrogenase-like oxidoreductase (DUF2520 family)